MTMTTPNNKRTSLLGLASCAALSLAACSNASLEDSTQASEGWDTAFPGKSDVYGKDSRRELNDPTVPDEVRERARAVSMVFNTRTILGVTDDELVFSRTSMSDNFKRDKGVPLCEDEPFAHQPAPGYCTAFLIAPHLMATAGHCVNGHTRCEQMGFIFDYAKESPEEDPVRVSRDDFYRCHRIVGRLYNPMEEVEAIANREYWYDWAVLELDRPVTDREPVTLAEAGSALPRGAALQVLGHPSGLPMKVTEGDVATEDKERYFNTTLDIYQGNSGSPVFSPESGEVHGIVIRGSGGNSFEITQATRPTEGGGFEITGERCGRSKVCEDIGSASGCIGNHVLRANPLHVFLEEGLKISEQHALVDDDEAPGFRHSFSFEERGEVRFVTLHLNAYAANSRELKVLLHHEGQEVVMMNQPKDLPYGRWSVTSEAFKGVDMSGEWVIEVINEGEGRDRVEWAQVMVGYR